MRMLVAAIHRSSRRDKAGREGHELGAELIELRRACDLLEVEFSETAARFAATDQYEVEGANTAIEWIRHQCRMAGHAAAERVCVGEQMSALPRSIAAVDNGEIGFAHLGLIARTASALAASDTTRVVGATPLRGTGRQSSVR